MWLKKNGTQTVQKLLFKPFDLCPVSANAGEQIADNTAGGSNGKWPSEIPRSVYFANNKHVQGK